MYVGFQGRNILWVSPRECEPPTGVSVLKVDDLDVAPETIVKEYTIWKGTLIRKDELFLQPSSDFKVAMVSLYGINCGIATYTKYLCDEMRPLVKELKLFAEYADSKDCQDDVKDNVVRCWVRSGDYSNIISEVEKYDPDIIYVQHEYGSFSHGANWNYLIGHLQSRWRTVVVLHSVYDHFDKLVFEAPCQEIIVHSMSGRELLKQRGITHSTINYIPHGCFPMSTVNLRFSAMQSKHVLFKYGFGFEYKGWENAITVVDKLKDQYPDLVYIGIFNVSKFSENFNNSYYDKLMGIVRDKNLEKHFVLHKGFRTDEVLKSYMAQSKVNIFPYWNHHEWRVHGASGAVRIALASGTPTIVGDVPFFSEFKGHIPVCSTIDEYVDTISKIFQEPSYVVDVRQKTANFIGQRTWAQIARWYLSVSPKSEFIALEKP